MLQLAPSGLENFEFRPLPARPMIARTVSFNGVDAPSVLDRVAAIIESTPEDAVVQLRVVGAMPAALSAAMLRSIAGKRNVTLAIPQADQAKRGTT